MIILLQSFFLLPACSGNSFHLRKNIELPKSAQQVQVTGLNKDQGLYKAFELALEESGGTLSSGGSRLATNASTTIEISDLREGKRVVSYTNERKVREYLVYLKFDYILKEGNQKDTKKQRVRLDRSFIYDANFALGKAEEEDKIRDNLNKEAARIMMLRLQYKAKK